MGECKTSAQGRDTIVTAGRGTPIARKGVKPKVKLMVKVKAALKSIQIMPCHRRANLVKVPCYAKPRHAIPCH